MRPQYCQPSPPRMMKASVLQIVRDGDPLKGMPAFKQWPEADLRGLVAICELYSSGVAVGRSSRLVAGAPYRWFRAGRARAGSHGVASCSYHRRSALQSVAINPGNNTAV